MAGVDQPLSDAEYARIAVMLGRSRDKRTMNLEMLDGFLAALICSPDLVPPSEYLREMWGGDRIGEFQDEAEMQEFFDLIMRHWNSLARTFNSSEPFMPFLLEDDTGVAHANDWAQGLCRGTRGLTSALTGIDLIDFLQRARTSAAAIGLRLSSR